MKAQVNQDICIGCGMCTGLCPEVFSMNDNGLAQAILDEVAAADVTAVEDAKDSCPVSAIEVE